MDRVLPFQLFNARLRSLWIMLFVPLLLIGCGTVRERTPAISDDWGRASLIGYAERGGQMGLAAAPDGQQVAAAWFGKETEDSPETVLVQIFTDSAELISTTSINRGGGNPANLQLITADDGFFVTWSVSNDDVRTVQIQAFDWQGDTQGDLLTIANDTPTSARWHKMAVTPSNQLFGLWLDSENTLFATSIEESGTITEPIYFNVINADFQMTESGIAQIAFSTAELGTQILNYTLIDPANISQQYPIVGGYQLYAGEDADEIDAINGPVLMLEDETAYVSWNRQIRTPAGSFLNTFVGEFELQSAESIQNPDLATTLFAAMPAQQVALLGSFPPLTAPATGEWGYSELGAVQSQVPLSAIARPNDDASPVMGQHDEVVFGLPISMFTRNRKAVQPALVYLQDGAIQGYQVLTWTENTSGKPALAADDANNLYVSWIDARFGQPNPVYMMGNSAEWRGATNNLTRTDYGTISYDIFNRMVRSVALIFTVIPWLVAGMFWVIIAAFATSADHFSRRAHFTFIAGIVVYVAVKYLTGLRGGTQILRFIPGMTLMAPSTATLFAWITPLIILAVSLILVWFFYIRRAKENTSAVNWFLYLFLTDYVISLLFYSIEFFA